MAEVNWIERQLVRPWQVVFKHAGTENWQDQWVIDGEKATLRATEQGMVFAAGPIANDHASHAVLWTKPSFHGDLKIDFDFTRLDTVNRYVNILYIQARGANGNPGDIHSWAQKREIPYMQTYFNNMNLLHISYAAFGNEDDSPDDYIRVRRYPRPSSSDFQLTEIEPAYFNTELFQPGVTRHLCLIKTAQHVALRVDEGHLFEWDLPEGMDVDDGPVGIRHMFCRCSRYRNFTISQVI